MKIAIILLGLSTIALASVGDRLSEFNLCKTVCMRDNCDDKDTSKFKKEIAYPAYMKLLLWDCPAECDYQCQQSVTEQREDADMEIVQFHGKWPFVRVWGVQEIASVLFSIGNFIPHYLGLTALNGAPTTSKRAAALKSVYLGNAYAGMNAWLWSTVFHTRDFLLTERLDYFSAALFIMYGFYTSVNRFFKLYLSDRIMFQKYLRMFCIGAYLAHVSYLSFFKFDYAYNMAANVVIGILQNSLWIWLSVYEYFRSKQVWRLTPAVLVLAVTGGMSFELFDFPPYLYLIDAHSLWHLSTILPTIFWYKYMLKDLKESAVESKLD